jgi:hypothetical protein
VQQAADTMIDQMVWWGNALKDARGHDFQAKAA